LGPSDEINEATDFSSVALGNALAPIRPDEFDAAAGHDEGREPIGSQEIEHFEHRLVDTLVKRPVKAWVSRRIQPISGNARKLFRRNTGMGRRQQEPQLGMPHFADRLAVVLEDRLEGLLRTPLRMFWRKTRTRSMANSSWK